MGPQETHGGVGTEMFGRNGMLGITGGRADWLYDRPDAIDEGGVCMDRR